MKKFHGALDSGLASLLNPTGHLSYINGRWGPGAAEASAQSRAGYDTLFSTDGCRLRLEEPVELVHWGADVELVTPGGSFRFDRAVLTLPLGVWRSRKVRFEQPFPGIDRRDR